MNRTIRIFITTLLSIFLTISSFTVVLGIRVAVNVFQSYQQSYSASEQNTSSTAIN